MLKHGSQQFQGFIGHSKSQSVQPAKVVKD
jgi:hypothetical protein